MEVSNVEKQVLKVEGMSWGHCKKSVEQALKTLAGVNEAVVDLGSHNVTIDYDPGVAKLEQLVAAIKDAGYDVVD